MFNGSIYYVSYLQILRFFLGTAGVGCRLKSLKHILCWKWRQIWKIVKSKMYRMPQSDNQSVIIWCVVSIFELFELFHYDLDMTITATDLSNTSHYFTIIVKQILLLSIKLHLFPSFKFSGSYNSYEKFVCLFLFCFWGFVCLFV